MPATVFGGYHISSVWKTACIGRLDWLVLPQVGKVTLLHLPN